MAKNQNKKKGFHSFGKVFPNGGKYYQSINKDGEHHGLISGESKEALKINMEEALRLYRTIASAEVSK